MIHKITRLFLDFEKEEKWLNEMSAKGLHFIGLSFPQYIFEEGQPGEYTYRLELLDSFPSHIESIKYMEFAEETGVERVDTFWRWVYFRKKTTDGPFDLFSDCKSKIRHYQRVMTVIGAILILNIAVGIYNVGIVRIANVSPLLILPSLVMIVLFGRMLLHFRRKTAELRAESMIHE